MKNQLIAGIFRGIAELLEIKGDNPFRIRAYLRAAETLENLSQDIEDVIDSQGLLKIPHIGADLANKIKEIVATGECVFYEHLKKIVPPGVVAMLAIPSIGPKTAKLFFERLKIASVDDLEKSAQSGRLLALPGIRQRTVDNILKGIALVKKNRERVDLLTGTSVAETVMEGLKKLKDVSRVAVAGSLRRMKETVRDIDILVAAKSPKRVSHAFVGLPLVKRVLSEGVTKASVLSNDGIQVDARIVDPGSFGAALLYFTGSKNHNIRLRSLAARQGLKINEYGIFDKTGKCLASKTEEKMYEVLGLSFVAPELREDTGEVEAALKHRLPDLVSLKDIRGDFHAHTSYSDGKDTVEAMARAARRLGYDYICLADHSQSLKIAHGLDIARLQQKKAEIDSVNKKFRDFRILYGTEVEIDADGRMDYKDDVLARFDVVVAAVHSGFKQSKTQLTKRIMRACQNRFVHIIAHPTGKLWPTRESYEIDLKEVFKIACDTNTALEINAHPNRLDLGDLHSRMAKESGVRLAIGTDSHAIGHLSAMTFGVGVARRAWLEPSDVLNSLKWDALLKSIRKAK